MYTFGYIREATQAHLDLDEAETQAMKLQERYHIFANEAMQAICSVKPKYDYFKCTIVDEYDPLINLGNNEFRKATDDEINWEIVGLEEPDFADEIDTKSWYDSQNIYLINSTVVMPNDFIAFAENQAWAYIDNDNLESFITGTNKGTQRLKADKTMFRYVGRNTLQFIVEGDFEIPYKGSWFIFKSGIGDDEEIDMPNDIFLTIPLYVASVCLQVDHAQKAAAKRNEFEIALARCTNTDFTDLKSVKPSFD